MGGINTYTYVNGDPISYADPQGLWINIAIGAAIGGLTNLGYQLWENNWNFSCVNPYEVARWVAVGALTGALVPEGSLLAGVCRQSRTGGHLAVG
jgi:hypothetical protein